ncbi:MAG TPA: PDZ domain-containing protein [Candidatus Udaeobacter sp.]|nr:PDZ domain-containing protein [Candidatus Udaeobacter sp.]
MKIKLVTVIAAMALLPIAGFAQTPPPPPQPPGPPRPPEPPHHHDHEKAPKVPMTFLGVETSQVPDVVSEQLGLSKGLGLVVEYVQPNSPAAQAGLQQNDILKTLNEQILIEPSQLRKLLQTFSEGTDVTLTILRKGQEQKVTVKLVKKEMPRRHSLMLGGDHDWDFDETGDLGEEMKGLKEHLKEQLGETQRGIREAAVKAREAARRAREDAQRAAKEIRMLSTDNGAITATKIDLAKAQVVFCDDHGEMKLQNMNGKKFLTAKDPHGKLLFSGPVETKEDLDKVPADVRQRYEKLQHNDLREVAPGVQAWDMPMPPPADADDDDETDADDDEGEDPQGISDQVSFDEFIRQPSALNSIWF